MPAAIVVASVAMLIRTTAIHFSPRP